MLLLLNIQTHLVHVGGFRMEAMHIRRLTTQAKFIGTIVSIAGAIIMTLYQGPSIISSSSELSSKRLLGQSSNWVLGGILLIVDAIFASMYIITQVKLIVHQ